MSPYLHVTRSRLVRFALLTVLPTAACDADGGPVEPSSHPPVAEAPAFASVSVCHRVNGPAGHIRIQVAERAVSAHLRHGDGLEGDAVPGRDGMIFDENCVAVPVAPVLISPAEGAILDNGCSVGVDPIDWAFDWTDVPGAERYHIYVKLPAALRPVIDDTSLPESEYQYRSFGYIADFNRLGWTWKVRAFVRGEWGDWSEERTFDVEPLNADCT